MTLDQLYARNPQIASAGTCTREDGFGLGRARRVRRNFLNRTARRYRVDRVQFVARESTESAICLRRRGVVCVCRVSVACPTRPPRVSVCSTLSVGADGRDGTSMVALLVCGYEYPPVLLILFTCVVTTVRVGSPLRVQRRLSPAHLAHLVRRISARHRTPR